MRIAFGLILILLTPGILRAQNSADAKKALAYADQYFAARKAGQAIGSYRSFLQEFPAHKRADYAIYMIGQASESALVQLGAIIPAGLFVDLHPEYKQYQALAKFLAREYGFMTGVSEGDPYWYYDMRAYRELLRRFPKSEYADDVRFLLVRYEEAGYASDMAWAMTPSPERVKRVRYLLKRYDEILRDYPKTNRKSEIERAITGLKKYLRR